MKKSWMRRFPVVATLALIGSTAFAQSAGSTDAQIKTAISHAGFASKAEALDGVHQHLHHVLNCLEGPQGKQFDSAAGDPCKGQGNGVLPDIKAKGGEDTQYYMTSLAAEIARQGIASNNLTQAKTNARGVSLILQDAAKAK